MEGRRLHAAQMLLAWMVLIPIAMFSARYYKETYSRVRQFNYCSVRS
jgi:hypothetical protein